jgi:hypothetical protein
VSPISEEGAGGATVRALLLMGFTVVQIVGGQYLEMGAGGALACITTAVTASTGCGQLQMNKRTKLNK